MTTYREEFISKSKIWFEDCNEAECDSKSILCASSGKDDIKGLPYHEIINGNYVCLKSLEDIEAIEAERLKDTPFDCDCESCVREQRRRVNER